MNDLELMTEVEFDRFVKNAAILLAVQNVKSEMQWEARDIEFASTQAKIDKQLADLVEWQKDIDSRLNEIEYILNVKRD